MERGTYDVIVVGLGAMGSATACALAARGVRVLGLERFDLPHDLGSSGGQSRLVRMAYFEHPDYVPLLRRAYQAWDEVSAEVGTTLFHRTGLLYLGPPAKELIAGTLAAASAHHLTIDSVDEQELARRFPSFVVPAGLTALYEADAGFVLSDRAIAAFGALALRRGAELRCRERTLGLEADGGGVRVTTDRGRYTAGHVVVTAGAWTSELLGALGVELVVTRQILGWVTPPEEERFALGRFPCWAIQDDAEGFEGLYYGFPVLPPGRFAGPSGLKLAHHARGTPTAPDAVERGVTPDDEETWRPALRRFLPSADGPTLAGKVCMYTMSPDEHFIVGRHPHLARVTLGCGFSGHGFKMAPAIGEALADLATTGQSALPVGFLSPERFTAQGG